ncbi:MAG TPA: TRAP transporter small permease subunit [Candidatus Limnocylindria bacterium]|jgi:TRAP-type mannitol/chloroaromatic compound transport system permease small subunit|nr:TRAP transporter small permease subunit [Candidatus Limnocylindria bacterium]
MERFLFRIDRLSAWSGKAVSWLIIVSTFLISYDVLMRYLSKAPFAEFIHAIWFTYNFSFDMSYYLYAVLFMIGGAYTLSRAQHVRGDVFYRLWPVKVQGAVDLFLYLFAFFPGVLALVSVGAQWAAASWAIGERSSTSFAAPIIYPLKAVIPLAALLIGIQGVAETIRAYQAVRTGVWPPRLSDVEETETILARQSEL